MRVDEVASNNCQGLPSTAVISPAGAALDLCAVTRFRKHSSGSWNTISSYFSFTTGFLVCCGPWSASGSGPVSNINLWLNNHIE